MIMNCYNSNTKRITLKKYCVILLVLLDIRQIKYYNSNTKTNTIGITK